MSILIPNRQMPKTCEECLLNYECDCRVAPNYNSADWESFLVAENGRREDCPLIELPSHGRLIDADATADFVIGIYNGNGMTNAEMLIVRSTLAQMPTIIESEGEE